MINFDFIIYIFLPKWPNISSSELNLINENLKNKITEHYKLIPILLKIFLNLVYILFLIYIFFIKIFKIGKNNILIKNLYLVFFSKNKYFKNFERFFRSLVCLYFYEEEIIKKIISNENN